MSSGQHRRSTEFALSAASAAAGLLASAACFAGPPSIGPQVRIDPGGGTAAANETTAAASTGRPDVIIAGWNDWRRSTGSEIINAGFSISFDRGATWSDFLLRPPAPFQTTVEGDPMAAFDDRTGTLWGGALAFGGTHLYVARLDPQSNAFNTAVIADSGGGLDKCWMAAGPRLNQPNTTRLYIAYNAGIIWSDTMGDTWPANPVSLGSGIGFLPRVGPNGEVYVAYWDFGTGMLMKRSLNDGASFTTHNVATRLDTWGTQDGSRFPGNFRVPPLLYFDVDMATGKLHAVYFDTTNIVNGQRNVNLYYTTSVNQGTSWTAPVVINTDNNPPGDQFFPWLEIDEHGRIHIVFFDSRHTVQNDNVANGMFDAYYMYSEDGGATWHEHRLTPQSWNSNNDGLNRGSSQFIGDYLGLATANNRVYPIYLDTTLGDPNTYTNVITFGEAADLTGFTVTRGTRIAGNLASLEASDDSYLRVRSAIGSTFADLHSSEVDIEADSPVASPASLEIGVETRINQPAGTLRILVRNQSTNQFDLFRTAAVNNADQRVNTTVPDATNYVGVGGEIEVRVKHNVIAQLFAFNFDAFIDHVEITAIE